MDHRYRTGLTCRLGASRSRRQVLATVAKGTVGGVGAALAAQGLGGSAPANYFTSVERAQDGECTPEVCPPVANPRTRRNVYTLSDGEIASLRRGVAVMKLRGPSDPTSWAFQANMHAVPVLMPEPMWCQHQSWFFLPWHRMYLYWFERILREASGDPSLTLPYWNYTDDLAQRALPRAFGDEFDAAGHPNPLFEPRRAPRINDGSQVLGDLTVSYSTAFALDTFITIVDPAADGFGGPRIEEPMNGGPGFGTLEAAPHGGVHVNVGGRNGIFFHTFERAGEYTYHCGVHPSETDKITATASQPPPNAQFVTIFINHPNSDTLFNPTNAVVPVGFPVRFFNFSYEFPHSAVADDGEFDTGVLDPPGLMFFPELAARDPIFWLHHANIDRLWERWLALKGGRRNPLDDCEWMDQDFTFYREDGSSVTMRVMDVLDYINCLGYRYDDPATIYEPDPPAPPADGTPVAGAVAEAQVTLAAEGPPDEPVSIGLDPSSITIPLEPSGEAAFVRVAGPAATPVAGPGPRISLTLEGVRDLGTPNGAIGVFVNPPDGVPLDAANEAFVGVISLFGLVSPMNDDMNGHGALQIFDITDAVRAAQARGDWQGEVEVTFVPEGLVPAGAEASTDGAAGGLAQFAQGPWVTVDRITVTVIE